MIFDLEEPTNTRIKEIMMANMLTKNWYAICDLTKAKNIKTKIMQYSINDLVYDIYAVKKDSEIFFEAFAHDKYCKEYGCKNWKHEQLVNFFLHDEEQSQIKFFTEDIKKMSKTVKKYNQYWEEVEYGMYLFILDGEVSSYG